MNTGHDRKWVRRLERFSTDVPLDQLAREIDEGSRYFWRSRQQAPIPSGFDRRGRYAHRFNETLLAVAQAIVAMGERPARGVMKRMATENGLKYGSLATKVCELRGNLRRAPRRAAA